MKSFVPDIFHLTNEWPGDMPFVPDGLWYYFNSKLVPTHEEWQAMMDGVFRTGFLAGPRTSPSLTGLWVLAIQDITQVERDDLMSMGVNPIRKYQGIPVIWDQRIAGSTLFLSEIFGLCSFMHELRSAINWLYRQGMLKDRVALRQQILAWQAGTLCQALEGARRDLVNVRACRDVEFHVYPVDGANWRVRVMYQGHFGAKPIDVTVNSQGVMYRDLGDGAMVDHTQKLIYTNPPIA